MTPRRNDDKFFAVYVVVLALSLLAAAYFLGYPTNPDHAPTNRIYVPDRPT